MVSWLCFCVLGYGLETAVVACLAMADHSALTTAQPTQVAQPSHLRTVATLAPALADKSLVPKKLVATKTAAQILPFVCKMSSVGSLWGSAAQEKALGCAKRNHKVAQQTKHPFVAAMARRMEMSVVPMLRGFPCKRLELANNF